LVVNETLGLPPCAYMHLITRTIKTLLTHPPLKNAGPDESNPELFDHMGRELKIVFRVESEWLSGMLDTDYGLYFNSKVLISIHSSEGQTVLMGNPHSLFSEAFDIPTYTDSFLLEVISGYIVLPQLTYRNYRRLRLGRPSLIFSRLIQLKILTFIRL